MKELIDVDILGNRYKIDKVASLRDDDALALASLLYNIPSTFVQQTVYANSSCMAAHQ